MDAMEAVAILILIMAIVVLVYYYLLNSPATKDRLRGIIPASADAHLNQVLNNNSDEYADLATEDAPQDKKDSSMTKRIKVKLSDIDMSSISTDAFSNKIDAFLDAKSDELIKDWSLATTEDLDDLQSKFSETTNNVDNLEKDFNEFKKSSEEFQKSTQEKLDDLDKRIESLENK